MTDLPQGTTNAQPRDAKGNDWLIYRRLLGYVRPYWPTFLVAVVAFLIGSAAEGYFARLMGRLIDQWEHVTVDSSLVIPLSMLAAALIRAFGAIVGESLLGIVSMNVVYNLRMQLFDQLLALPSRYFDSNAQGHLVSRITFNVAQMRDTGTDALKSIVQDFGKVIVFFGMMLWLSWQLTLIFLATIPLLAIVVMFASKRFRRISRRIQTSMGDVTHVASEAVNGYRVVKIFGGEDYEQRRFQRAAKVNRQQNLKMVVTKVFSTQVNEVLVAVAIAGLIILLFRTGVGTELTAGQVVEFLGLAGLLARPIRKLSEVNAKLQRGLAAAEDVFSQLDEAEELDGGTHSPEKTEGHLVFRNVAFQYERSSEDVLNDINLEIQPGQTVALVGRSGSGKSTLASLIPRFYEISAGAIELDGKPLTDYSLSALRDQIALVNQQVTLFNDTLERNIAYGSLAQQDEARLWDAINRAHADEFINDLPDGLDTLVGDDGVLLSGGQRQRVAIARALLKDAPILILDEATSALDTESERHIQAALQEVMRGRTTLVIAHRLSTIESADLILVMDEGRIVERGTHSELLAQDGAYAALYNSQFDDDAPITKARPRKGRKRAKLAPRNIVSVPTSRGERLQHAWETDSWWLVFLRPFAWLFGRIAARRRHAFATGARDTYRAPVPVVVVGNIVAGGTGKTPFVQALVRWLQARGYRPGVASRGHGGKRSSEVIQVPPQGDPALFGDEPVLHANRLDVPVVIGQKRVDVVRQLVEVHHCDVVVCDDGLQHYALARDLEIAVVDGARGLANGRLLPAGPLREPADRLAQLDLIVVNGPGFEPLADSTPSLSVTMQPTQLRLLSTGECYELDHFALGQRVHAVAGIGNPERFGETLRSLGFDVILHAHPDHKKFSGREVQFDDALPVIVTAKDAVKLERTDVELSNVWSLEAEMVIEPEADRLLDQLCDAHGIPARHAQTEGRS